MISKRNYTHRRRGPLKRQHGGDDPPIVPQKRLAGESDFTYAIRTNDLEYMRNMIESVPEIVNRLVKLQRNAPYLMTPIEVAIKSKRIEALELLLTNGANVNLLNSKHDSALYIIANNLIKLNDDQLLAIARMLVAHGADMNFHTTISGEVIPAPLYTAVAACNYAIVEFLVNAGADLNIQNEDDGFTSLHLALTIAEDVDTTNTDCQNIYEIIKLLIRSGANVNTKSKDGDTPLKSAMYIHKDDSTILNMLIAAGADINGDDDENSPLYIAATAENMKDVVRLLVKAGATVTPLILERAHPSVKMYLKPWKGFTRGDMEKFNTIFDPDDPRAIVNISVCPVCLAYVERRDACNYMSHKCSDGSYIHEELYDKYKDTFGQISWCTVCGRICNGHQHYQLGAHDGPRPELAPAGNLYTDDCSKPGGGGGGGPREKIMRFRAMRRVAHELLAEVDKMTHTEAMDILVQEMWLPGISPRNASKVLRERRFNDLEFPPNVAPLAAAAAAVNPPAAASIVAPLGIFEVPDVSAEPGENAISADDTQPVITFRHATNMGEMLAHSPINKDSVVVIINRMGSHTGFECFEAGCGGVMWPEEIRQAFANPAINGLITEPDRSALQNYTGRFNEYFATHPLPYVGAAAAAQAGGAEDDIFQPATTAVCTVPPRRQQRQQRQHAGAKRTTKRWKRGHALTAFKKGRRASGTRMRRAQRGPTRRAQRGGAPYAGNVFLDISSIIINSVRQHGTRGALKALTNKVVEFIAQATPEELNAVDKKGRTMLNALIEEIAIQNRIHRVCLNPVRTRVLAALLDKNADYSIRNGEGKLPIHYTFACPEIFDILMVHIERTIDDPERMSAYVNETMSTTGPGAAPLIFEAASSETDVILHKLLAYGADPNTIATINRVNYTPLKYALSRMHMYSHPHYNIPLLLLARGAHTLDSDNPEPLLIQMLQYNPYGGELSQHNASERAESTLPDEIVDLMVIMIEHIIQANPSPLTMRSVTGETPYMIALKSPYEKIRNIFTPENITRLLEGMGESARAIVDKYKRTVQPPRPNIYGWTPEKILRMKSRNLQ